MELDRCYQILGVAPDTPLRKIKTIFRRKIKSYHPDSALRDIQENPTIVSELTEAYHTVMTQKKISSKYSIHNRNSNTKKYVFDYRLFLYERQDKFEYQTKLFTFDLLYGKGLDSLRLYEQFQRNKEIERLKNALGYHDYYDFLFLLSESLENDDSHSFKKRAMKYYFELCTLEFSEEYFKEYFSEVLSRMKRLFFINRSFLSKKERMMLQKFIPHFKISNSLKSYYLKLFCS